MKESLPYQNLRTILPIIYCSTLLAAPIVVLSYGNRAIWLGVCLFFVSILTKTLEVHVFSRARNVVDLDIIAFLTYGSATTATFNGLASGDHSPVACGLIVAAAVTSFSTHVGYFVFVTYSLVGYGIFASIFCGSLTLAQVHLLIITPVVCVAVRTHFAYSVHRLKESIEETKRNLTQLNDEQALRLQSEKQLADAQKMEGLGLIAAGVAHDFNNHLQAITASTDLISIGADPIKHATQIQRVTSAAADICSSMLAYAGKAETPVEAFELRDLVEESLPMIRLSLPDATIRFDNRIKESAPIVANRSEIREGVLNLIRNAGEATDENGQITILLKLGPPTEDEDAEWHSFGNSPIGSRIELWISDNGCGMEPKTLARCFDPYFTTKQFGHGFGLATTLGNVRTCGGQVKVRTKAGSGTTFRVIFPIHSPNEKSIPIPDRRQSHLTDNQSQSTEVLSENAAH